jgi:hypothetical protein
MIETKKLEININLNGADSVVAQMNKIESGLNSLTKYGGITFSALQKLAFGFYSVQTAASSMAKTLGVDILSNYKRNLNSLMLTSGVAANRFDELKKSIDSLAKSTGYARDTIVSFTLGWEQQWSTWGMSTRHLDQLNKQILAVASSTEEAASIQRTFIELASKNPALRDILLNPTQQNAHTIRAYASAMGPNALANVNRVLATGKDKQLQQELLDTAKNQLLTAEAQRDKLLEIALTHEKAINIALKIEQKTIQIEKNLIKIISILQLLAISQVTQGVFKGSGGVIRGIKAFKSGGLKGLLGLITGTAAAEGAAAAGGAAAGGAAAGTAAAEGAAAAAGGAAAGGAAAGTAVAGIAAKVTGVIAAHAAPVLAGMLITEVADRILLQKLRNTRIGQYIPNISLTKTITAAMERKDAIKEASKRQESAAKSEVDLRKQQEERYKGVEYTIQYGKNAGTVVRGGAAVRAMERDLSRSHDAGASVESRRALRDLIRQTKLGHPAKPLSNLGGSSENSVAGKLQTENQQLEDTLRMTKAREIAEQHRIAMLQKGNASERTIQEQSRNLLKIRQEELKIIEKQRNNLIQIYGSYDAYLKSVEGAQMEERYTSEKQAMADMLKLQAEFKENIDIINTRTKNTAELERIRTTTMGDAVKESRLLKEMADAELRSVAGMEQALPNMINLWKSYGMSQEEINKNIIQYQADIQRKRTEAQSLQLQSLQTKTILGMERNRFELYESIVKSQREMASILPTSYATQLNLAKQDYALTIARIQAINKNIDEVQQSGVAQEVKEKRLVELTKERNQLTLEAGRQYMDMTGGIINQMEVALGQLTNLPSDIAELRPRAAEQVKLLGDMGKTLGPWKGSYGRGEQAFQWTSSGMAIGGNAALEDTQAAALEKALSRTTVKVEFAPNAGNQLGQALKPALGG